MDLEQILTFWAPELNELQRHRIIKEIEEWRKHEQQSD
jgi:hypothetical protein